MKVSSHGYAMSAFKGHHGNGMKAVGLLDSMQKMTGRDHEGKAAKNEKADEVTISNTARSLAAQEVAPSGGLQAIEGSGSATASAGGQHVTTVSLSSVSNGWGDTDKSDSSRLTRGIRKMQSIFDRKIGHAFKAFDKGRIDAEQLAGRLFSIAEKQAETLFTTLKDLQGEVTAPSGPAEAAQPEPATAMVPPASPVVNETVAAGVNDGQAAVTVEPAVDISDTAVETAWAPVGVEVETAGATETVLSALVNTLESVTVALAGIGESDGDDGKAVPPGLADAAAVKTPPGLAKKPGFKPPGLVDNPAIEEPPGLIDNPSVVVSPEVVDTVESKDDEVLKAETEDALAAFMDLFDKYEDFFSLFADQINAGSSDSIFQFVDQLDEKLNELEQAYKISTIYLQVAEDRGITPDLSLNDMVQSLMDQQDAGSQPGRFVGINAGVLQMGLPGAAGPAVHVGDTESGTQGSQQVFRMSMSPLAANQRASFGFKDHDPLAAYRQSQFVAATTSVISNMSAYV